MILRLGVERRELASRSSQRPPGRRPRRSPAPGRSPRRPWGRLVTQLTAEDALVGVDHSRLRDGVGERDVDGTAGAHAALELVGHVDRTGVLALAAADAVLFDHVARLASQHGAKAFAVARAPLHLGVREQVMLGWWATADILGVVMQLEQSRVGKTLLRPIICSADARVSLDDADREALVGQVEGRTAGRRCRRRRPGYPPAGLFECHSNVLPSAAH